MQPSNSTANARTVRLSLVQFSEEVMQTRETELAQSTEQVEDSNNQAMSAEAQLIDLTAEEPEGEAERPPSAKPSPDS